MFAAGPSTQIPAVVVGGSDNCGGLGVVRSLGRAGVPVVVIDREYTAAALHSHYARKLIVPELSGPSFVRDLLNIASTIKSRPVLFLTSDEAALTVSRHRTELEKHYRFRLPSHQCLVSLMQKNRVQELAIEHDFPVPRAVRIRNFDDLRRLTELSFPAIIKPSIKTDDYLTQQFERGYRVTSLEQAVSISRRILPVLPDMVVQEWIEGADSAIHFCLVYRGRHGTVSSFTGRKLSIWPPDVGTTASCTAAPEAHAELHQLTDSFFNAMAFVGMGSMEFKRDDRTGQFFMIEPTVGRVDWQEEVATLNGANIPLAAYLHEIGAAVPAANNVPLVIWSDSARHWKAARGGHTGRTAWPKAKVYDAYWRIDDPLPALFHALSTITRALWRMQKRREPRRSGGSQLAAFNSLVRRSLKAAFRR